MGWKILEESTKPGELYYRRARSEPWMHYKQLPKGLQQPDHKMPFGGMCGSPGFATMQHLLKLGVKYAPREEWP